MKKQVLQNFSLSLAAVLIIQSATVPWTHRSFAQTPLLSQPPSPAKDNPPLSLGDLDLQLASTQTQASQMLVRVRNPGTKTANAYGGPVTPEELLNLEKEIRSQLNWVERTLEKPIQKLGNDEAARVQFEQETLDRLNVLAHSFHALLSYAQIKAFSGHPLDPVHPQFSDGTALGVRVAEPSFSQILGFSPLYDKPTFHNSQLTFSPKAYYANQLGDATGVVQYTLIPSHTPDEPQHLLITPKSAILGQIANLAQANRPSEQAYMQWARDLTLIALTEGLVDHSFLLQGQAGLTQVQFQVQKILHSAQTPTHLSSQILALIQDRQTALQTELLRNSRFKALTDAVQSLEELKIPTEQTNGELKQLAALRLVVILEQWNRALSVPGTAQAISGQALQTYFMQSAETWFTQIACAGLPDKLVTSKSQALHRAFLKLDWAKLLQIPEQQIFQAPGQLTLEPEKIELERKKMRDTFDAEYLTLAKMHYPLYLATQDSQYFGLKKAPAIPESFLDLPVLAGVLKNALQPRIQSAQITSQTAMKKTIASETLRNAIAPENYPEAKAAYLKGLKEIENAAFQVVQSPFDKSERKELIDDLWKLKELGSLFGFNISPVKEALALSSVRTDAQQTMSFATPSQGSGTAWSSSSAPIASASTPSTDSTDSDETGPALASLVRTSPAPRLRDLPLSDAERRSYAYAYLEFHWNTHPLLMPSATQKDLGNLLEKLAGATNTSEANQILTPGLNSQIQSGLEAFAKVAQAKKPEDLVDLLTLSPFIKSQMRLQLPGFEGIVNRWQGELKRKTEPGAWDLFFSSYSKPMMGFMGVLVVEFLMRNAISRPLGWAAGKMGWLRAASVVGPRNAVIRTLQSVQSTAQPYFASYFAAYLGLMAYNIGHEFSAWREMNADSDDLRDFCLAQSGGKTLCTLTQLDLRTQAADSAWNRFWYGNVVLNAAFFLGGPLLKYGSNLIAASRERAMLKYWEALGVRPYDFYKTKNLWDEATITRLADEAIASVSERHKMERFGLEGKVSPLNSEQLKALADRELAQKIRVNTARESLLAIRARDARNYELALRDFEYAFQNLGMKKPSFKDSEIKQAFIERMADIRKQMASLNGKDVPLKKMLLRLEAERAETAHRELKQFAMTYVRFFPIGPFARILHRLELKVAALERGQNAELSQLDEGLAYVDDTIGYSLGSDTSMELSQQRAAVSTGQDSTKLDALRYSLSSSYRTRMNSVYQFWESGDVDFKAMRTAGLLVWQLRDQDLVISDRAFGPGQVNYYTVLNVSPLAEQAEIDAAFQKLTAATLTGAPQKLSSAPKEFDLPLIQEAYVSLSDPARRAAFDLYVFRQGEQALAGATQKARIAPQSEKNPNQYFQWSSFKIPNELKTREFWFPKGEFESQAPAAPMQKTVGRTDPPSLRGDVELNTPNLQDRKTETQKSIGKLAGPAQAIPQNQEPTVKAMVEKTLGRPKTGHAVGTPETPSVTPQTDASFAFSQTTLPASEEEFFKIYTSAEKMPNLYQILGVQNEASPMQMRRSLVEQRSRIGELHEQWSSASISGRKSIGKQASKEGLKRDLIQAEARYMDALQAYLLLQNSAFRARYDIARAEIAAGGN